jgi:hypothetical protein
MTLSVENDIKWRKGHHLEKRTLKVLERTIVGQNSWWNEFVYLSPVRLERLTL